MRNINRWIVLSTLIWTGACATAPHPNPIDPAAREAAAVRTRWIGQTRFWSRKCPVPAAATRWTVSPFFPTVEPAQGLESPLRPSEQRELRKSARRAGLDRFCIYEYQGTDPRPDLPRAIKQQLRPGAAPDKVALAGAAALEDMTRDPFQQRFFDQVQSPRTFPGAERPAVRLTFLDTEPTHSKIPASSSLRTSAHGYSLMQIAGHLAGGGGESAPAVQITSRLALPLKLDPATGTIQKSESSGGSLGTFADLAVALRREIVVWHSRQRAQRERHLVINLSLGWDGEKLHGWEKKVGDMPPEVRLVYDTLQFAAHEKVLVIAAAGNERMDGSTGKPLLPAGWEGRTTPERRWKWWKREARPIIYAVSGVDGRDNPLVNTRALGEAPRVAYADHVVVRDLQNPNRVTPTLTGTSVASAVTSTAAALIWQYRPELDAAEVMRLLDESGRKLPRPADFATKDPVRRIALCPALARAVEPLGWSAADFECPPTLSPRPPAPLWAQLSTLQPELVLPALPLKDEAGLPPKLPSFDQIEIGTQPGENPCPNCAVMGPPQQTLLVETQPLADSVGFAKASFSSSDETAVTPEPDYRLLIEIPAAWADSLLQQANVEIFSVDPDGARKLVSICPVGQALPGQVIEVTGCFKQIPAGQAFQASLSFVLVPKAGGPGFSIDSPLFVEYQD